MVQILGLMLLSLFITFVLFIPFIDFLYKMKVRRQKQKTVDMFDKPTTTFDRFHGWKEGTPFGGGVLIIVVVSVLSLWAYGMLNIELKPWEIFALIIASVLYTQLGYDFIFIRGYGLASLGFLFIPLAAFVIVSFTNAFNIADGLDGLAPGLLLICLGAFLAISAEQL